jgi:hypothetical protein
LGPSRRQKGLGEKESSRGRKRKGSEVANYIHSCCPIQIEQQFNLVGLKRNYQCVKNAGLFHLANHGRLKRRDWKASCVAMTSESGWLCNQYRLHLRAVPLGHLWWFLCLLIILSTKQNGDVTA